MARARKRLLALSVLLVTLTAGCLLVRDVDALSSGYEDDGSLGEAAAGDAPTLGDGADASADGELPCPGDAGPTPVRVGAYCIDSTEVTVKDYREFLAIRGGDTSGQPARCAWNVDITPGNGGIPGTGSDALPIVNVDYCDALLYCAWAGKRLCGALDGGMGEVADFASASKDQWYRACSHDNDGLHEWPYSNTYEPTYCNGRDNDAGNVLAVGTLPECYGGYSGISDMSGNAREWEDACDLVADPDASTCLVRGGAFYDIIGTLSCANRQVRAMTQPDPGVGIRCCSP